MDFSFFSKCCLYLELKMLSLVGLDGKILVLYSIAGSVFPSEL